MARLSMNELTTYRWSFEEDVERYAQAGIPAIGVWRQKLSDYGESKGVELLAEKGLAVSNLGWAGGFTGSDGRTYRDALDDAFEAVRLAGELKAPALVVYTGSRGGHTHNHARRLMVDALKELAPAAEQHEVTLALEPMHAGCAAEWTFLTELDDALAMLEKVGHPRVALCFDTYHLGFSPGVLERIPQIVDRIRVVHLGDGKTAPDKEQDRTRLGEGALPLGDIISALSDAGYDGDYDVELIGEEIGGSDYLELIEHAKTTFGKLLGAGLSA